MNNYFPVAAVKAIGNSNSVNAYSTVDDTPSNGISYYSLKQVDYDGKFTNSALVAVNINSGGEQLFFYPDQQNNGIRYIYNGSIQNFNIQIFDATGRIVFQQSSISNSGFISLPFLATGIYTARFLSADGVTIKKFFY